MFLIGEVCCPRPDYTPAMCGGSLQRDDLIAEYFAQGFAYKDILVALLVSHGIAISLKTLKRTLKRLTPSTTTVSIP